MVVEGVSQKLKCNHYCGHFITSFICACRDLNFRLQLCDVVKTWVKLKVAQLAHFSLLSRLIIVFRDISKLWEDKLSVENQAYVASCLCMFLSIFRILFFLFLTFLN